MTSERLYSLSFSDGITLVVLPIYYYICGVYFISDKVTTVIINSTQSFVNEVTVPNRIYVIASDIFLGISDIIIVGLNSVLQFNGGCIHNGKLIGQNTRISNPFNSVIFDGVELEYNEYPANDGPITGWLGACKDIWFNYSESTKAHYKIVKSVCQFEKCIFSHRRYYIDQWERIPLRCFGCEIHGGGATWILPANKGTKIAGWNNIPKYATEHLLQKRPANNIAGYESGEKAGVFLVSDLTILDNDELIGETGWGESMSDFAQTEPQLGFTLYRVFDGCGNHTEFRNVHYDGPGGLWSVYNYYTAIHRFIIEGCSVKSAQFAFELGTIDGGTATCGGNCDSFIIQNSRFFNYEPNVLVGPLSVVGNTAGCTTKHLQIEGCVFESQRPSNLETFGCEIVDIRNSTFLSVQCSSGFGYQGETVAVINRTTNVIGNYFGISDALSSSNGDLRIYCGDLNFLHNEVVLDYSCLHPNNFVIWGFGHNLAVLCDNTFVFKRTDLHSYKEFLLYHGVVTDMRDNHYIFTDGVASGYEPHFGGDCPYLHLDSEYDPRFANTYDNGYKSWNSIPSGKQTPEGLLQKGETLTLDNSFNSLSAIEFDFRALLEGQGRDEDTDLFSFLAGTNRRVIFQTYYGTFRIKITPAGTNPYYSSEIGVYLSLPDLGFDTMGKDLGHVRFVLVNETISNVTQTRVILYINDYQVDTFYLKDSDDPYGLDVLSQGISSIQLYGSTYFRIRNYRILQHIRTIGNPIYNSSITNRYHDGYPKSGPTTQRPSHSDTGFVYFDTTLGKPVFYTGTGWVDATGTTV